MSDSTSSIWRRSALLGLLLLGCYCTGCASFSPDQPATVGPVLENYQIPVFTLTFCANGKQVATGGAPWAKPPTADKLYRWGQGEIKVWDAARGQLLFELKKELSSKDLFVVFSLVYLPDEDLLVSRQGLIGYSDKEKEEYAVDQCVTSFWNLPRQKEALESGSGMGRDPSLQRCFRVHQINKLGQLALSADSKFMAETNCAWMADILDTSIYKQNLSGMWIAKGPKGMATCAAISPDNKVVASGGGPDKKVVVWEIVPGQGGKVLATLQHNAIVNRLGYTADGKTLAALDDDGTLKLWNLETQKERYSIQAHQGDAFAMAVSPDGKIVATGGVDKAIKLWDTATGKELASRPNQKGRIQALAFSPDGKRLASSACDPFEKGEVKLWETAELLKK